MALQSLVEWAKHDTNRYLYNIEVSMEFTAVPNPVDHRRVVNLDRNNWVDLTKIEVSSIYYLILSINLDYIIMKERNIFDHILKSD